MRARNGEAVHPAVGYVKRLGQIWCAHAERQEPSHETWLGKAGRKPDRLVGGGHGRVVQAAGHSVVKPGLLGLLLLDMLLGMPLDLRSSPDGEDLTVPKRCRGLTFLPCLC